MADEIVSSTSPAPESTNASDAAAEIQGQLEQVQASGEASDALDTASKTAKPLTKTEKKLIKQLKLKVDGKEYTEDLPFEIPDDEKAREYMTRQLQMSKMGQSRAQELSKLDKEIRQFVDNLRKDPFKVLKDPTLNVDLKGAIAQYIDQEIENSKKSPEQLEKEKLQAELQSLKDQQEKEKKDWEEREFTRLQEEQVQRYDSQIFDAISKTTLPQKPYVVKKVAEYMLLGLQKGVDLSADDIMPLVQDEIRNDIRDMFGAAPDDVVEQLLGKDVLSKIRKKNIAKAKTTIQAQAKDVGKTADKKTAEPAKKLTFRDFFGT